MPGYESDTSASVPDTAPSTDTAVGNGNGGGLSNGNVPKTRPQRPCDACRKRKSRCEIPEHETKCVLCAFHKQPCTFVSDPPRKKRRTSDEVGGDVRKGSTPIMVEQPAMVAGSGGGEGQFIRRISNDIRKELPVRDYAELTGPTLLKKTLGLQYHRHTKIVGSTSLYESRLLSLDHLRPGQDFPVGNSALRLVSPTSAVLLIPDAGTRNQGQEISDLDAIESLVAPHGQLLINLYFRIVHPTFPILHKKVFLEKYARTHREFSPPLLAAVYILSLNWWSYSAELAHLPKPDAASLREIAFKTMSDIVHRPKLSTIQAGLLLLQTPEGDSWSLITQLVGLGQDLGLHLDCTNWRIPGWEKGLRKRLAWGLFVQDKWGSLVHGRPSHITVSDWDVQPVDENDFPERAADEDDEEGSTEVEKGRILFSEMIALARILSDILANFYTLSAEAELRAEARVSGVAPVLQRAKPLQLRLKSWFADLPESLRLQDVTLRKLSSTGYLHLAYYATEITLHRQIVRALSHESNPELVRVCRAAARERLVNALSFVNTLRPEHLQSFWHSASTYCFALVGTFISLLWATESKGARADDDADFYRKKLDEYRWALRLSSRNAEIMERALGMMSLSTGVLLKAMDRGEGSSGNAIGGGVSGNGGYLGVDGSAVPISAGYTGTSRGLTHLAGVAMSDMAMTVETTTDMTSLPPTTPYIAYDGTRRGGNEDGEPDLLSIDSHHLSWFADIAPLDPSAGEPFPDASYLGY
jgi:hypothetical protein